MTLPGWTCGPTMQFLYRQNVIWTDLSEEAHVVPTKYLRLGSDEYWYFCFLMLFLVLYQLLSSEYPKRSDWWECGYLKQIFWNQSFIFSHKKNCPVVLSQCKGISVSFLHYECSDTLLIFIPGFSCNIYHKRISVPLLILRPIWCNHISTFAFFFFF